MTYLIYKILFESGKIYIGRTSNLKNRKDHHKYNKRFIENVLRYEILEENLSYDESFDRETFYISSLNAIENGYNKSPSKGMPFIGFGEVIKKKHAENPEYKLKCVSALKSNEVQRIASIRSEKCREIVSKRNIKRIAEGKSKLPIIRKPVYCFETETVYSSSCIAGKILSMSPRGIRRVANGERNVLHNHTFKFAADL